MTAILALLFIGFEVNGSSIQYNKEPGLALARTNGILVGSRYGFKNNWKLKTTQEPANVPEAECIVQLIYETDKSFFLVKTSGKHQGSSITPGDLVYFVSPEKPLILFDSIQFKSEDRLEKDSICALNLNSADLEEIKNMIGENYDLLNKSADNELSSRLNEIYMTRVEEEDFNLEWVQGAMNNDGAFWSQLLQENPDFDKKYLEYEEIKHQFALDLEAGIQKSLKSINDKYITEFKEAMEEIEKKEISIKEDSDQNESQKMIADQENGLIILDSERKSSSKADSIEYPQELISTESREVSMKKSEKVDSPQMSSQSQEEISESSQLIVKREQSVHSQESPKQVDEIAYHEDIKSVQSQELVDKESEKNENSHKNMIRMRILSAVVDQDDDLNLTNKIEVDQVKDVETKNDEEEVNLADKIKIRNARKAEKEIASKKSEEQVNNLVDNIQMKNVKDTESETHSVKTEVENQDLTKTITMKNTKDVDSENQSSQQTDDSKENLLESESNSNGDEESEVNDLTKTINVKNMKDMKTENSSESNEKSSELNLADKIELKNVQKSTVCLKSENSSSSSSQASSESVSQREISDLHLEEKSSQTLDDEEDSQNDKTEQTSSNLSQENESTQSESDRNESTQSKSENSSFKSLENRIQYKYTDMSLGSMSPTQEMEMSHRSEESKKDLSVSETDQSSEESYEQEITKLEEKNSEMSSEHFEQIKESIEQSENKSSLSEISESFSISNLTVNEFIHRIPEILQEEITIIAENEISKLSEEDFKKIIDFTSKFIYERMENMFSKSKNKLNMLSSALIQFSAPYPDKAEEDLTFKNFVELYDEEILSSELINELVNLGLDFKINISDEVEDRLKINFEKVLKKTFEDLDDAQVKITHEFIQKMKHELNNELNQSLYINVFTKLVLKTTDEVFENYAQFFEQSEQNLKYNLMKNKKIDTKILMKFLSYRRDYVMSQTQESVMVPVFTLAQFRLLL